MENKEERNIVDLNNENIKKYSFVLTDEINGQKYKVEYEPIFLYEKDKYIYGMFTNFKKDEKDNIYLVNCRYLKNHSQNFTIEYKLPENEIKFLEEQKNVKETKDTIYRYKRLYNRVDKDYNRILELNKKLVNTTNKEKEELKDMLNEYNDLKESINSYNPLKKQILSNWNVPLEKLNNLIDMAINNINLKLNKNKEVFKAVLVLVAIAVFIIACISGGDNDTSSSSNDGYSTKCYTRSDGKNCCISCKKTSYGDIGCSRTCN